MLNWRSVWIRRVAIACVVALLIGYVPYHLYAGSGLWRFLKLRDERDALHAGNLKLYAETQRLRQELDVLAPEDPQQGTLSRAAVERTARDALGMVRPGEVVYRLSPEAE